MSIESEERREDHLKWRTDMESQLKANTEITNEAKAKIDEVYNILDTAKGAFKFFSILSTVMKWLGIIAAAITAIWVFVHQITHGGSLPK